MQYSRWKGDRAPEPSSVPSQTPRGSEGDETNKALKKDEAKVEEAVNDAVGKTDQADTGLRKRDGPKTKT